MSRDWKAGEFVNLNQVLRFATWRDYTPIYVTKANKEMWITSPPKWFIPAEKVKLLYRVGLDIDMQGRYSLHKGHIEPESFTAMHTTIFDGLKIEAYPVELVNPVEYYNGAADSTGIAFNDGEVRVNAFRYDFFNGDSARYCPERNRVLITRDGIAVGLMEAIKEEKGSKYGVCIVCKKPALLQIYKQGTEFSVCGNEHINAAIEKKRAIQFLDSIIEQDS